MEIIRPTTEECACLEQKEELLVMVEIGIRRMLCKDGFKKHSALFQCKVLNSGYYPLTLIFDLVIHTLERKDKFTQLTFTEFCHFVICHYTKFLQLPYLKDYITNYLQGVRAEGAQESLDAQIVKSLI
jgi:hypothetical protein